MPIDRRAFVSRLAAGGAALGAFGALPLAQSSAAFAAGPAPADATPDLARAKAIAFDAFPIFDPRPAFKLAEERLPERGEALRKGWFDKIFAYTWLRTCGGRHVDFDQTMADALDFAAASQGVALAPADRADFLAAFRELPLWPDVLSALDQWRDAGVRLAFLSNMTEGMLRVNARRNGVEDRFEFFLSADLARAYKPSPACYQLGVDAFRLPKEEIAFAAFAGWDAAGATWFGYPTAWVNRAGAPLERLDAAPAATARDLSALAVVGARDRAPAGG